MALARVAGGRLILVRRRNVEWVVSSRGGFAAIEDRLEDFGVAPDEIKTRGLSGGLLW